MKILCWNVNGIRTTAYGKGSIKDLLEFLNADILCFQETKLLRDQLDESIAFVEGYNSYFSFSRGKVAYSGVATYCKTDCAPIRVEEGLSNVWAAKNADRIGHYGNISKFNSEELSLLDAEGRAILTEHKTDFGRNVVVINVYCPRADPEKPERLNFKLKFYELLQERAEALLIAGKHVVIVGDVNTSHKPIDHCEPDIKAMQNSPSCHWLDNLLIPLDSEGKVDSSISAGKKFIDSFRYFYPRRKEAFTCWSTVTSARKTNYGTRIDYIIADKDLVVSYFAESQIQPEIEGSDHCPIYADLKFTINPSDKLPWLCTKYMSEFSKKQSKLTEFLKLGKESTERSEPTNTTRINKMKDTNVTVDTKGSNQKRDSTCPVNIDVKRSKSSSNKSCNLLNYFFTKPSNTHKSNTSIIQPTVEKEPLEAIKDKKDNNNDSRELNNSQQNNKENKKEDEAAMVANDKSETTKAWKSILSGPPPIPLCSGHKVPSVMRTVKKSGPNQGRRFYVCTLPEGRRGNPNARCNFFQWAN
ncbi:uncharacterized protein TRIADDRAFT_19413 [Trichoplax adhaerens]|uniref:DNA-(apurinic or apyrimidinic site) endonuclease n=1 Tax=Trichoplax adhaerens TaxID=10228 RepID=B3RI89_TRIAD|nr:hypothetical protein TRIADDRAFT_19413 [Trichoplax adhaerens]EDV28976.1 hypothetical protein TRIADDRAFT_19413 [Trichoplax adhaerens]|eukprot:XP_002108178.1 hypothetical protein TRIADDRAFT_19413 [Trichoplax adhaerens]